MPPTLPDISDAEWQVMGALWRAGGPVSAGEVVGALRGRVDWSPRTVKTLLGRLVKKGAVAAAADGADPKRYLYRPRVARDAVVRRESRSFLDRVFGGRPGAMLAQFVQQADLTPEEIRELQEMLRRKQAAAPRRP